MGNEGKNSKFINKNLPICIIGLGYVGLPLAITFANAGFKVIGIDINKSRVEKFNAGLLEVEGTEQIHVQNFLANGLIHAESSFESIAQCQATLICVPTPLDDKHEPDLSFVIKATEEVVKYASKGMLVVLESTVYPGTTKEILEPLFALNDFKVGEDIFICFSPERVDPGRKDWATYNTPKIIGGMTPECLEKGYALYSKALKTIVKVSSTDMAEMTKILENSYRAVNIAFINEIMKICDVLNLNVWELVEAAGTKPFGFMKFLPGPGVGGHCIPIDPLYLTWKLKQIGHNSNFISLAHKINSEMPQYWVSKAKESISLVGKTLFESQVLVLGVTYKKDCEDFRESPSLDIIKILIDNGACVEYYDPYVSEIMIKNTIMHNVTDLSYALEEADCVIIATDHTLFKNIDFSNLSSPIINCRGDKLTKNNLSEIKNEPTSV